MINLKVFKKILELIKETDVTEVEIQEGEEKIRICRGTRVEGFKAYESSRSKIEPPVEKCEPNPLFSKDREKALEITSPFVGTFYRSSNPEGEPFIEEGSLVKKGDVLCIVEAMKLMNEIESEVDGKISSILVDSGEPVEFGQPLFKIESLAD